MWKRLCIALTNKTHFHDTRHDSHAKELTVSIDKSAASGLSGMRWHTGFMWLRLETGGWRFGFHKMQGIS